MKKNCSRCGDEFEPKENGSLYCSFECSRKAFLLSSAKASRKRNVAKYKKSNVVPCYQLSCRVTRKTHGMT